MYYLLWSCVSSFGKRPIGLNALIKYYYYQSDVGLKPGVMCNDELGEGGGVHISNQTARIPHQSDDPASCILVVVVVVGDWRGGG